MNGIKKILIIGAAILGGPHAFADQIGSGTPSNGTNDATNPNDTEVVGTSETGTLEAWWNDLLESLGFENPADETGMGGN